MKQPLRIVHVQQLSLLPMRDATLVAKMGYLSNLDGVVVGLQRGMPWPKPLLRLQRDVKQDEQQQKEMVQEDPMAMVQMVPVLESLEWP